MRDRVSMSVKMEARFSKRHTHEYPGERRSQLHCPSHCDCQLERC